MNSGHPFTLVAPALRDACTHYQLAAIGINGHLGAVGLLATATLVLAHETDVWVR